MRKTIGGLLLLALLLTACNLPSAESSSSGETIATRVANTLTAELGSEINPVATSVSSTLAAKTSEALQTASPSPLPTQTAPPTASPLPSETPTPTLTPALDLGSPTWRNTLDKPTAFGLQEPYQDANSAFSVANGVMVIKSFNNAGYRGWRLTSQAPANIYLQGIYLTRSCAGQDQYGLVLRAPDYESGQGYYLGLTCDGQYRFVRWDATGVTSLASGSNPAILGGSNQTNRLAIRAEGSVFKLYANDKLLQEVTDSTFTGSGHFGVYVAGVSRNLVVDLDEIAYWTLP